MEFDETKKMDRAKLLKGEETTSKIKNRTL